MAVYTQTVDTPNPSIMPFSSGASSLAAHSNTGTPALLPLDFLDDMSIAGFCCECGDTWHIVAANHSYRQLAEWHGTQSLPIPHSSITDRVHPDDRAGLSCALLETVYSQMPYTAEYRLQDNSGQWRWLIERGLAFRSGRQIFIHAIVSDISASRAIDILECQNDMLARAAYEDRLTGLPTRAAFLQMVADYLSDGASAPTAVVTLDIARFREINEGMGYAKGSELLCNVTARLWKCLVDMQAIAIARLDGDRFAVLMPSDGLQFVAAAQAMQQAMQEPFDCNGIAIKIDIYIGGALIADNGEKAHEQEDASEWLRRAEIALYAAKRRESHCCLYEASMDSNSKEKLLLLTDLRRALHSDELILFYQPKQYTVDGCIKGCEALLRWQHPEKGMIPPGNFIPLVENSELIHPITYRVMQLSLEQICRWMDEGKRISVAINISAHNLMDDSFVSNTCALLGRYPQARGLLEMEITESTLMSDPKRAATVLHLLARQGIPLAIDDFGTGYSSLAYLKKLPITALKIDRSFVMDMETDSQDRIIVKSTIDLAHNLGLSVVAEGVETKNQMDDLIQMGCDYLQGYFISRPLPASELKPLLEQSQQKSRNDFSI